MTITPTTLAQAAGISVSYASQILNGTRRCSTEVALVAYRQFDARLGLLAELTDADLQKLCDQGCHTGPTTGETPKPATDNFTNDVTPDQQEGLAA